MNNFYNSTISKDGNLYLHNLKIVKSKKTKGIVCYECKCSLVDCNDNELLNNDIKCRNCIKEICCLVLQFISINLKRPLYLLI